MDAPLLMRRRDVMLTLGISKWSLRKLIEAGLLKPFDPMEKRGPPSLKRSMEGDSARRNRKHELEAHATRDRTAGGRKFFLREEVEAFAKR